MRSVHLLRIALPLVSALTLSACLDSDSGGSDDDTRTGSLTANGISGVSYTTASRTGKTDSEGRFDYYPGETLTFRVGDLALASGIPAKEYITPLEFFEEMRDQLSTPRIDDQGLRTHSITEEALLEDTTLINMTRLLLALNWEGNLQEDDGIDIRDRVISQLNAALPNLTAPIDFTVSEPEFSLAGPAPSPANQLLAAICFYPEDDLRCDEPPTQAEIDALPPEPDNNDDIDPEVMYQEDLQSVRNRILDAKRSLQDFDEEVAENYLARELGAITTIYGNRFYVDKSTASHPASDTAIKQVELRRVNGEPDLVEIEAVSTREQDVAVHSFDWQSASVEYFVAGDSGEEAEVLISFRPEGNYRWLRKSLRVTIR